MEGKLGVKSAQVGHAVVSMVGVETLLITVGMAAKASAVPPVLILGSLLPAPCSIICLSIEMRGAALARASTPMMPS